MREIVAAFLQVECVPSPHARRKNSLREGMHAILEHEPYSQPFDVLRDSHKAIHMSTTSVQFLIE